MTVSQPNEGSFLIHLSPPVRESVLAAGVPRSLPAGRVLFHEGDPTDDVLILLDGWVRVCTTQPDNRETLLALRGPGDVLGDSAALTGWARAATVSTLQEVHFRQVPGQDFRRLVARESEVAAALLRNLYERERESTATLGNVGGLDVARRIAAYLLRLAEQHGRTTDDGLVLPLPLTQRDIANHVGATRRTVARALAAFRARGLIRTGRGRLVIARPDVLRLLAR